MGISSLLSPVQLFGSGRRPGWEIRGRSVRSDHPQEHSAAHDGACFPINKDVKEPGLSAKWPKFVRRAGVLLRNPLGCPPKQQPEQMPYHRSAVSITSN